MKHHCCPIGNTGRKKIIMRDNLVFLNFLRKAIQSVMRGVTNRGDAFEYREKLQEALYILYIDSQISIDVLFFYYRKMEAIQVELGYLSSMMADCMALSCSRRYRGDR